MRNNYGQKNAAVWNDSTQNINCDDVSWKTSHTSVLYRLDDMWHVIAMVGGSCMKQMTLNVDLGLSKVNSGIWYRCWTSVANFIQESPADARVTRDSAVIPRSPSAAILGYYRTGNSAIRSADPENPCLELDIEWIGSTVSAIFAFKLYCDLETGVWGHWRSSKVALFDRAHTNLFVFHSNYAFVYYRWRDIAAYWSKIATPLVFGTPFGGEAVRFTQRPLVSKN